MLEETWHTEYSRRPDLPDNVYPGVNVNFPMWDSYPVYATKPKKEENVGLAEAITSSILSTGIRQALGIFFFLPECEILMAKLLDY